MGKIIYSLVTKKDAEYSSIMDKILMDIGGDIKANVIAFAIDEDTKDIIAYSLISGRNIKNLETYPNDIDLKIKARFIKIFLNYLKNNKFGDNIQCEFKCHTWDEYQELHKLGFEPDKKSFDREVSYRNKFIADKELAEKKLENCEDEKERKYLLSDLEFYTEVINRFLCYMTIDNKKINQNYNIEEYVNIANIPKDYFYLPSVEEMESEPYKTDDKYNYYKLRKEDKVYKRMIQLIKENITDPNLMKNGGTLMSYLGLEYPELIVYLRDKENRQLVGYIGLTTNYGIGLYISQIAVHLDYKRQGIGTIMVKEAINNAFESGIDKVSADIGDFNHASLGLFSSMGFQQDHHIYLIDVNKYVNANESLFINGSNLK